MPTRDNRSSTLPILAQTDIIGSNTTTDGSSIDTKDYDGGLTFNFLCTAFSDGSYIPILEESATGSFGGEEVAIADAKLIGTELGATMAAATVELGVLPSIGIHSTLRYVRATIVSSGTSSGATITTIVTVRPEVVPSGSLSA